MGCASGFGGTAYAIGWLIYHHGPRRKIGYSLNATDLDSNLAAEIRRHISFVLVKGKSGKWMGRYQVTTYILRKSKLVRHLCMLAASPYYLA